MRRRARLQKSQARRCRLTVLGKLFTLIVPAAYCQVYDSCHMQADYQEPGSAPEPYARQSSIGYLYFFYFWLFTLSQTKTICNSHAHPTWKCTTLTCEIPNFFYLTEGLHCTRIFRTCVFHSCRFVLAFSVHAFSILAKCAVSYLPFPYLHFPVLAFSAPPFVYAVYLSFLW